MLIAAARTVLVVDDDRAIRLVLRTALERRGYQIIESRDGGEALAVLEADEQSISLVISDVGMPCIDGIELVEALERRRSTVPVILTSGRHTPSCLTEAVRSRIAGFVAKPFSLEQMLSAVDTAIMGQAPVLETART